MRTKRDIAGVIAPPPVIFAFFLIIGIALHFLFPLKKDFMADILAFRIAIGLPVLIVSGILPLAARAAMKKHNTPVNPEKPTTAIVTEGPYRITRNPFYLSLFLLYIAICLLMGSIWLSALFPAMALVFHFGVVLREERYLENKFGAEYIGYKGRVRRWI